MYIYIFRHIPCWHEIHVSPCPKGNRSCLLMNAWRHNIFYNIASSNDNPLIRTYTLPESLVQKTLNPLGSGDAFMIHWWGSSSVQVMACHMFVTYHYLNQLWIILEKMLIINFQRNLPKNKNNDDLSTNWIWECCLPKFSTFFLSQYVTRLSYMLWD